MEESKKGNIMDGTTARKKEMQLPWWQKYSLTLTEASEYFGIGYKKLKLFIQLHPDEKFVFWNGNRAQIKRELFEKYLNEHIDVI